MADENNYRVPLVSSIGDMGANVFKMWNFGYSGTLSKPSGFDFKNGKWSVGGMLGIPAIGALGAGIGAAAGAMTDSPYGVAAGALIGGAAVLSAPSLLGLGARGVLKGSASLGSGMFWLGKNAVKNFSKEAAVNAGASIGSVGIGALGMVAGSPLLNGVFNPSSIISESADASKGLMGVKFNAKGKALLGLGTVINTARDIWDTEKKIRMGQIDPEVRRATPNIPAYADNAGATGDLVFALNKNRRG